MHFKTFEERSLKRTNDCQEENTSSFASHALHDASILSHCYQPLTHLFATVCLVSNSQMPAPGQIFPAAYSRHDQQHNAWSSPSLSRDIQKTHFKMTPCSALCPGQRITSPQGQSPTKPQINNFLDLPAEIRLEIYRHTIATTTPQSADKFGDQAILPPLLATCRLIRNEAIKVYFFRVCRYTLECRARSTAFASNKPRMFCSWLEEEALWAQKRAARAAFTKARRIQESTENMLLRMGYPVMTWLRCSMDERW